MSEGVPFNKAYTTGRELDYIREAVEATRLAGNGPFSARCADRLRQEVGAQAALMTHSCTGALEMSAILADLRAGDEVVMPAFTFVSTANAVVLRGAVPVFVDVRPDTLNIDEGLIEDAITERTRAVFVVHYAGVACEMDEICAIADRRGLVVLEDAAQALGSLYRGRPAGSFGAAAALSFHETKNLISGEGGALLVNDPSWVDRAEIIHEKGTDRRRFFRGEVDKYTWVDVGSSFLMSDLTAAFLWAQLEEADAITELRRAVWETYHEAFAELEHHGLVRRPVVPEGLVHNAHIYYLLLERGADRDAFLERLHADGVSAVFHYVPLHTSPAGTRYGRTGSELRVTDDVAERLVRLPLWAGMSASEVERVVGPLRTLCARLTSRAHRGARSGGARRTPKLPRCGSAAQRRLRSPRPCEGATRGRGATEDAL